MTLEHLNQQTECMIALWLIAGLLIKHFVCDFPLQFKYMLEEKGTYLADGGIHHAFFHGFGTAIVFSLLGFYPMAGAVAVIDILIHYHADYFKVKLNKHLKLTPADQGFWHLLGLDQLVHGLTYVLLVGLALAK